jgi:plasmid stabilization system protein ParE
VARVEFASEVLDDFDRILEHLTRYEVADAQKRVAEIIQALQILTHSPLIGRPVRGGKRELVIGQASRGYLALYRFVAVVDTVFVLAIRSQRERGYRPER